MNLQILKNKNLFKRQKFPSPNAMNIKYFCTLSYNHWGFLSNTELSNGLFQKKNKEGRLRTYLLPLDFLNFLLYPWKFQTKQGLTPRNSTKFCYIHPSEILRPETKPSFLIKAAINYLFGLKNVLIF